MKQKVIEAYINFILNDRPEAGVLEELKLKGLATDDGLTEQGRSMIKVVLAGGVFDIIHPGHVYFLRKAKELGDVLVVVVARDVNVVRFKGKSPMNNENLRRELVGAIKYVDAAILGDENDLMKTVQLVRPDIIALGYDQVHSEKEFSQRSREMGISLKVVRLDSPYPWIKSKNMKNDPRAGWL